MHKNSNLRPRSISWMDMIQINNPEYNTWVNPIQHGTRWYGEKCVFRKRKTMRCLPFTTCHIGHSIHYAIPLRHKWYPFYTSSYIFNAHFNGSTWYKILPWSCSSSEESCPMLLPGRKGARSAGCWDPENLVKLEEWGDRGFPVIEGGRLWVGVGPITDSIYLWYIYQHLPKKINEM